MFEKSEPKKAEKGAQKKRAREGRDGEIQVRISVFLFLRCHRDFYLCLGSENENSKTDNFPRIKFLAFPGLENIFFTSGSIF